MIECDKPKPRSSKIFLETKIDAYSKEPEEITQYIDCLRAIAGFKAAQQKRDELARLEKEVLSRRLSQYSRLVSGCSWIGPQPNYYNGWTYMGSGHGFKVTSVTKVVNGKVTDFSANVECD